jgi:PAS domain S-box-containing protein
MMGRFPPLDLALGRLLGHLADAAVLAQAPTGRIVGWNAAAEALFGYSAAEAVGSLLERLVDEPFRAECRAQLAGYGEAGRGPEDEQPGPIAWPALRKSGERIAIELTLSSIQEVQDDGPLVLAIVRDVTERRRSEEGLRVLAEASHDLRGPLTYIKGQAQILRRCASAGELMRMSEGLAGIETAATRMAGLIDEVLDAARLREGQPLELERRPTDLVALARRVAAECEQTTSHHTIRCEAHVPRLVGRWDAGRLERVLGNLLGNAVKYSPRGSEITLAVARSGATAVVAVRDPGVGIPAEELPRIFERFYRGSNVAGRIGGTGLGLAGVKRIVEQHGGTIEVESVEGTGSTFTVRLPLRARRA